MIKIFGKSENRWILRYIMKIFEDFNSNLYIYLLERKLLPQPMEQGQTVGTGRRQTSPCLSTGFWPSRGIQGPQEKSPLFINKLGCLSKKRFYFILLHL